MAAATPSATSSHLQDQASKQHETGCQPKKLLSAFASRPQSNYQQSEAKDREHDRISTGPPGRRSAGARTALVPVVLIVDVDIAGVPVTCTCAGSKEQVGADAGG